nr:glycosyltransferase [uncultured Faecalimonas sp.]
MKVHLSISLLVSDRKVFLERCLDSLSELRRKVPSELIVVFTGEDPEVRKIIEKYTDKIVPFEWCDDFSAARNCGLKEAVGEWFMYLDDDEWFEDTEEIENFFLSGECEKYDMASYNIRNYEEWRGTKYVEFCVYRIRRRFDGLHFQNPIHEQLVPMRIPYKRLGSYIHHYGYVNQNGGKNIKKTSRNIPMLLKDIETHPEYLKNYAQLVNEYYVQEEWENVEKYCRIGRMICKKQKDYTYEDWFIAYQAQIFVKKEDLKTAIKEIENMLSKGHVRELIQLKLYSTLINLCVQEKQYEETLLYGEKFEKLLLYMDENVKLWQEQEYPGISEREIKEDGCLYAGRCNCIVAALSLGKEMEAEYFFNLLPWEADHKMQQYYPYLDRWRQKFGDKIEAILKKITYSSPYLLLQRVIDEIKRGENEKIKQSFLVAAKQIKDEYLMSQLIRIGLENGIDLSPVIEKIDLESWELCVRKAVSEMELKETERIEGNIGEIKKDFRAYFLCLRKEVLEKSLFQKGLIAREFLGKIRQYCDAVVEFYGEFYQQKVFCKENSILLPKKGRFAIGMLEGLELYESKKYVDCIRLFRDLLEISPEFTSIINELVREIRQNVKLERENKEELILLGGKMKEALDTIISQGQYQQALPVVEQLLTLLPDDLEVLKLREKLLKLI